MAALPFRDRDDAARQLAVALVHFRGTHPVVLAIPRGAVPIGGIVAEALLGELDVVLVHKLGAPFDPEFAIGAVDEHGAVTRSGHAALAGATEAYVQREIERQLAVIRERRARYRPGQPAVELEGRTVIVLDDGLATGATMLAALKSVRAHGPSWLVCAIPVAARDSLAQIAPFADEVVCLAKPWPFIAVGQHYRAFADVSDTQVVAVLAKATAPATGIPKAANGHAGSIDNLHG